MTMAKTCKYKKMRRYVSYDSGNTWAATSTYVKGDLIERNSPSCGGGTDSIEWRQIPITEDYVCNGANKHYKERKYVNGVATQETRMGQVYEYLSADCGGSDVPSGVKWIATLSDGTTTSASCNSNTIVSGEVPTEAVTLRIGTCVTKIDNYALQKYSKLTAVAFPNTLKHIGKWAFYRCTSLQSINIPSGLEYLGTCAFEQCTSVRSISVPSGITQIDECSNAFNLCTATTELNIAEGTTEIPCQEFPHLNSLETLSIPSSVRTIGEGAFYNAESLTSVTIPNSVTTIGKYAFRQAKNLRWIDIGSGVTSIGKEAFNLVSGGGSMQYITVRALTPPTIGSSVFSYTNNCPIYVPCDSYEAYYTAWSAYRDRIACSGDTPTPTVYTKWEADPISEGYVCDGTTKHYRERKYTSTDNVNWTRTDETRKGDAYEYDSVDCGGSGEAHIEQWVAVSGEYICDGIDKYAKERLRISEDGGRTWEWQSETRQGSMIEEDADDCNVPNGVKWIATLSDGTTASGASEPMSALTYNEVPKTAVDLRIGRSVKALKDSAVFAYSGLTSLTLPSTLETIERYGIYSCGELKKLKIPKGVNTIGDYGVAGNSGMESLEIDSRCNFTSLGNYIFSREFSIQSIPTLPQSMSSIPYGCFDFCSGVTEVTIPSNIRTIGDKAFNYSYSMSSLTVSEGVVTIGAHAFDSAHLKSLSLPSTLTTIGNNAFAGIFDQYNAMGTSEVVIPSGVLRIGDKAFGGGSNTEGRNLRFLGTTPPTLDGLLVYDYEAKRLNIKVPSGCSQAYKTAWPQYASYISE